MTLDERAELRDLVNSPDVTAAMATRAQIVLWPSKDKRITRH